MRALRIVALCLAFLPIASTLLAQQLPDGPVPPAVLRAKKVFIANAGADSGLFPHPFSGDQNRAYSEFYAGAKALGRFDIVDDPAEADVVLELQLTAPSGPKDVDKSKGSSDPLPMGSRDDMGPQDALCAVDADGVDR